MTFLREAVQIPERVNQADWVVNLDAAVRDPAATLRDYVVTPQLVEAFDRAVGLVAAGVSSSRSQAAFVHGSFGSGKSHFMAVLDQLLGHDPAARSVPDLAPVIARHDPVLSGTRILRLNYHLIGAESLESAVLGGYVRQVRERHPGCSLPAVHETDALLDNAEGLRARMGDEAFLESLSSAGGGASPALGGLGRGTAAGWTLASYDQARAAAAGDQARTRLVSDLVSTLLPAFATSTAYVDLDSGLAAVAAHARSLGYDAVVLFLDELILWLASHLSRRDFVSSEGAKLAKLVEAQDSRRDVPVISFVARQRDLVEFLGQHVPGAERAAFSDVFGWARGRFEDVRLDDRNLPLIAERRVLRPTGAEGVALLDEAFARVERRPEVWDVLLTGSQLEGDGTGSDQVAFRRTYPFSPALVSTLVALSQALQRERTALIVMQRLLVAGRDELEVSDLVPVGDLFDVLVDDEVQTVTDELKTQFETARRLYHQRLRPALLDIHRLTVGQAEGLPRDHAFRTDDRLVKTVLLAALAPDVPALSGLTGSRLAALNHGTIRSWLAADEGSAAVHKMRLVAAQVPELRLGEGDDPLISVELTDVDVESVVKRASSVDNDGNRRRALRQLVWESLGIEQESTVDQTQQHSLVWRGRRTLVDLVFGNVRDTADLPDPVLLSESGRWRVVIDYPYDEEGQTPRSDLARVELLREAGVESRTLLWLPAFLSPARVRDLGRYVVLEHLLGGTGERFSASAEHLSPVDREQARNLLRQQRSGLRERLLDCLKQAYGCGTATEADIDVATATETPVATLEPGFRVQVPVGATLRAALTHLLGQAMTWSSPAHPQFVPAEAAVTAAELRKVLAHCERAVEDPARRTAVDAVDRGALRRVCGPLEVGQINESVFVLNDDTFPWSRRLLQAAARDGHEAAFPVRDLLRYLDEPEPRGLAPDVAGLVVCAFALARGLAWYRGGVPVDAPLPDGVKAEMELRQPPLPDSDTWLAALPVARQVFGVQVAELLGASTLARLAHGVREAAARASGPLHGLDRALAQHRADLGVADDEVPPRFATLAALTALVDGLQPGGDDVEVVRLLAAATWPTSAEAAGRCRETAEAVTRTLTSTEWDVVRALRALDDHRRDEAEALGATLRDAAGRDEMAVSLSTVLPQVQRDAVRLITVVVPDPQVLASGRTTLPAGEVEDVLEEVRRAAASRPGGTVTVSWEVRG